MMWALQPDWATGALSPPHPLHGAIVTVLRLAGVIFLLLLAAGLALCWRLDLRRQRKFRRESPDV